MKSINQIFASNPELREAPEVKELIEYCQELEGQVIESTQASQFSFEDKLASLVRDIFTSIKDIEREEQEHQRFDFDKPDLIDKYLAEPVEVGQKVEVRGLGIQDKKRFGGSTEVKEVNEDGSIMIHNHGYSKPTRVEPGDYKKCTYDIGANPFPKKAWDSALNGPA